MVISRRLVAAQVGRDGSLRGIWREKGFQSEASALLESILQEQPCKLERKSCRDLQGNRSLADMQYDLYFEGPLLDQLYSVFEERRNLSPLVKPSSCESLL